MQYIFLLYSNEAKDEGFPSDPAAFAEYMKPWIDYNAALTEAGVMRAGEALKPTATATTVSREADAAEPVFTDGPFAETKEQLGGFYIIECDDLDQALAWAAKCPLLPYGRIEVRPVQELG